MAQLPGLDSPPVPEGMIVVLVLAFRENPRPFNNLRLSVPDSMDQQPAEIGQCLDFRK